MQRQWVLCHPNRFPIAQHRGTPHTEPSVCYCSDVWVFQWGIAVAPSGADPSLIHG